MEISDAKERGNKHVEWKELDYPLLRLPIDVDTYTYICVSLRGIEFKEAITLEASPSPPPPLMRIGPVFIVAVIRRNEASREINRSAVLSSRLTRFRFHGNDRPGSGTILCHLSSSCLREPTGAEVFICFSHSNGRPPRAPVPAGRWLVRIYTSSFSSPRPPPPRHLFPSLRLPRGIVPFSFLTQRSHLTASGQSLIKAFRQIGHMDFYAIASCNRDDAI